MRKKVKEKIYSIVVDDILLGIYTLVHTLIQTQCCVLYVHSIISVKKLKKGDEMIWGPTKVHTHDQ